MKHIENWYEGLSDPHKIFVYSALKKVTLGMLIVAAVLLAHDYSVLTHPHYYRWAF